jgi:hypothetical protein
LDVRACLGGPATDYQAAALDAQRGAFAVLLELLLDQAPEFLDLSLIARTRHGGDDTPIATGESTTGSGDTLGGWFAP